MHRVLGVWLLVLASMACAPAGGSGRPAVASSGGGEGGGGWGAGGRGGAGGSGRGASGGAGGAAPAVVCDVKDYGASGDGHTKDTAGIQAAIDACAKTGGKVSLHDGVFLSGMIVLASDVELAIAPSATLLGSQDAADYPDVAPNVLNSQLANCKKTLVYAESAQRVRIDGGGTIDGNAKGVPDWKGSTIKEGKRPMAIFTALSTDVTIEGLTVKDAGAWAVVNLEVDKLTVRGLTVSTDLGPTHDGIDVVDGHDVLIEDCNVASGDDSICLKSGSARGTHNVLVKNCHTTQSGVANGVKLGTASVGSFQDITVQDTRIEHAQAAAMAVESVDGAAISNVVFRHIQTNDVGTPFFVLLGSRSRDASQVGSIDGVTFDDIQGANMRYGWGSLVTGSVVGGKTFTITNVQFENLALTFEGVGSPVPPQAFGVDDFPEYQGPVPNHPGKLYNPYPDAKFLAGYDGNEDTSYHAPGFGLFLRHVQGVTFKSCKVSASKTDARPWSATKDASQVTGACTP